MMKNFSGRVLFLDRSDINTDEIIPAKYLTENTKEALKPYLLEDLELEGFSAHHNLQGVSAIVTRENFGCGSSREHAPWALEMNGINLVIAVSFARIFRQNMFNCGMMAVDLPSETIDRLFTMFADRETTVATDFEKGTLHFTSNGREESVGFAVSEFDRSLVRSGGWIDYADSRY